MQIALPENQQVGILEGGGGAALLDISRDGKRLVYVGERFEELTAH
ncbi:MAG: hypothetical protein O7I93_13980 [Gemmatimonadetes bacterium]|nr:hypothetical protein [Gemmatimonadota bacterium]